jgi:hypothetical protein
MTSKGLGEILEGTLEDVIFGQWRKEYKKIKEKIKATLACAEVLAETDQN